MRAPVIETIGLGKAYRARRSDPIMAVDGVDLLIPEGGVHGYLGPNGSGKTTTLRLLVGLAAPTSGQVKLFGEQIPNKLPHVISRVGAVIDTPKFFGLLTGRQNLALLASPCGISDDKVNASLDRVGLSNASGKRYRTYSLGMKQRLSLAAALMRSPELLILDEPTNGLDPSGMRELRNLLREVGDAGTTVLLSSHILADVQQLCETVTVLHKGRVVTSGRVDEILNSVEGATLVQVDDVAKAVGVLSRAGFEVSSSTQSIRVAAGERPERVATLLVSAGVAIHSMSPEDLPLELAFLRLTETRDQASQ